MRFPVPELKTVIYETEIKVRYGDIDALGHLNGVMYLRYLEQLRMEWLASIDSLPNPGEGPVLINAFCIYHRQVKFPATLRARLYCDPPGRSSLDTYGTLESVKGGEATLHATGGATIVWMDMRTERSKPLPPGFRQCLI
jgi:acyl-CoA thioester hydrolase